MTIFCYTAIFGDTKDKLHKLRKFNDVEYVAFVDTVSEPTESDTGWLLRPPVFNDKSPRRQARQHKVLSHEVFPEADVTVWVDGTMTPWTDPRHLMYKHLPQGLDICTFRHIERTCVYQEGEACARSRRDDVLTIRRQMDLYREEGYPYHNGLAETSVVLRRHTPEVVEFNEMWWAMIEQFSLRDQMSFDYVSWKLQIPYKWFDENYQDQRDFAFRPHW